MTFYYWKQRDYDTLHEMFHAGSSDLAIGKAIGKSKKSVIAMRQRLGLFRDPNKVRDRVLVANTVDTRLVCRQHLIDLMREMGGETLGDAKAAYRARCEVSVDPGYSVRFHGNVYSIIGSGCGSPAFMCMGD